MNDEINHLLDYISNSSCVFMRNGSEHSALDAVEHIKKKYEYYKEDIDSAEEFIEFSASKSTFSKKAYYIQCPGESEVTSRQWLLEELTRYRKSKGI